MPNKTFNPLVIRASLEIVDVIPAPHALVRMPDREFAPLPTDGARVPLNAYYAKAIAQGDLIVVTGEAAGAADAPQALAEAPMALNPDMAAHGHWEPGQIAKAGAATLASARGDAKPLA